MKILMLTPYLPYPLLSGGQIRTYNLLKQLASQHDITLLALIKEEHERQYIPELKKYCTDVQVFKRSRYPFTLKNILQTAVSSYPFLVIRNHASEVTQAIQNELDAHDYDLIHAETFYMMPHLPETEIPVILAEQTIEYLGYESYVEKMSIPILSSLLKLDVNKIKRWELHYWENSAQLITMSKPDKEFITDHVTEPSKIEVVKNGVDIDWFAEKEKSLPSAPTVLFVGTFKWLPNVEAVQFLIEKVWPLVHKKLPTARLQIVGNAPTTTVRGYADEATGIDVVGRIPDIRDAFATSHVLAAPVFSGKGTRYKILEGLASRTPVVASSVAVEGLSLKDREHVLLADKADEMADRIVTLLKNKDQQESLSKAGYTYVTEHFEWSQIANSLDTIYQKFSS